MTAIAPTLQRWFVQRLASEQHVSPHTVAGYRDSIRLLVTYIHDHHGHRPTDLDFEHLDPATIGAFLTWLETDRHASIRTRNVRLSAIRSFLTYASFHHPEHAQTIARVLAIPAKRAPAPTVTYLTQAEMDALLTAPDTATWTGRRDRCLLTVGIQTGLRVAELIAVRRDDLNFGTGGHLHCVGKGRRQRAVPLTRHSQMMLTAWLDEHTSPTVFSRHDGQALTRDAVRRIIDRHVAVATKVCPTMSNKRVTPHVLRHTCAMQLLRSGVDIAVIALILGHAGIDTTRSYLHADHDIKQAAIDRLTPPGVQPGRYQPTDALLAFLDRL
jgi:site-specific recombinase XerD